MKQTAKRILWVDDELFHTNLLADVMEAEGIEVVRAKDATEGKQLMQGGTRFDLVIMDVMMPPGADFDLVKAHGGYRTGLVLARWIHGEYPNTQIIGYSIEDSPEVRSWFEEYTNGFVSKRTSRWALVDRVKKELGAGKMQNRQPRIFLAHGHDKVALLEVKNYLQNTLQLGAPIILHERASLGRTIIEKFEEETEEVELVFVLLTPDDLMAATTDQNAKQRARQNVIFELGYFYGRLKRKKGRVILLAKHGVEMLSDLAGIVYIDITDGVDRAGEEIRRELSEWL